MIPRRALFLVGVFFFLTHSAHQQGWEWQNPLPQGNHLNDLFFVGPTHGWAVASRIMRTTDGGETWNILPQLPTQLLNAVFFADVNNGWCAGYGGLVIHTTNGGDEWVPQPSGTTTTLRDIFFLDAFEGWAVGDSMRTLHTTDGGIHWTKSAFVGSNHLLSVQAVDRTTLWGSGAAGSFGPLYRSTDGGNTWSQRTILANRMNSICFVGPLDGWVVGNGGLIWRTTDGGGSWARETTAVATDLQSVSFRDVNNGWVVGASGVVLRTTNGGATWGQAASQTVATLTAVRFRTESDICAVGYGGAILRSSDAGVTWTRNGWTNPLRSAAFIPPGYGWCVGSQGILLKTTDHGGHWFEQNCGLTMGLNDVEFMDADSGWILGDQLGAVLHTTNGGASWGNYPLSFNYGARDLKALPRGGTGWRILAAGDVGYIYWSTNFGYRWDGGGAVCTNNINEMSFGSARRGWTAGPSGEIRTTADSGFIWSIQNVGASPHLWSVSFCDTMHGCVVGTNGAIFQTTNGGLTWNNRGGYTARSLFSVHLRSSGNAWAVGAGGTILHSSDGGYSWGSQQGPSYQTLLAVRFISDSEGWIVGDYGTILHTTDGGGVVDVPAAGELLLPSRCVLEPNFPNPFNPATTLRFQISEETEVRLSVHDLLGREVRVLVNGRHLPGMYEVPFDASGLASGVYLGRLVTGSTMQVRRMMLIR